MAKPADMEKEIRSILASRKYAGLMLPEETLRDLLLQELPKYNSREDALKSARQKLHNIVAPYLDHTDYDVCRKELKALKDNNDPAEMEAFCIRMLRQHDSTRERLPYMHDFYCCLQDLAENPAIVLDLACGLNPFALPWMSFDPACEYHAYDIHTPRVALENEFLQISGRQRLAEVRDILVQPPEIEADAAWLFKEAHRLEKRRRGCSRDLFAALNVKKILVTLPTRSLRGERDLQTRMRHLIESATSGRPWKTEEIHFPGETLFCITK